MLPEHLRGKTIHFVGPEDDYDDEENADEIDPEFDQMKRPEKPEDKRKKLIEKDESFEPKEVRLTKHLREIRQFPPMHTGGAFHILKDERHALAMNDLKICLLDIQDHKLLATLEQENEDIATFAISPN